MAIDPRLISSGIQMGRSLAPQGPPIQEMLGMKMQQNQMIAEIMKELLKQHMSDIGDLRKSQFMMAYKAWTDPNLEPAERDSVAEKILNMDMSGWGTFESMFTGKLGKKVTGAPMLGSAQDILAGTSQAPENYYTTEAAITRPSFMQGAGRVAGQAAMAPIRGMTAGVDTLLKGLRRPGTTISAAPAAKDQYGFTIDQTYRGYRYIGNNQWQKQ